MNNNNYIVITGWMVNELKLKGSELLIYALIYGFSQDGESKFYGSRKYISEWFNCSLPTVDKALNGLLEKKLIIKIEELINGVKFNRFIASKVSLLDIKKSYRDSKEILHNNTIYNTNNIKNIYKHFENIFVRTLNGIEVQMIDKWLEDKTEEEIINAINECAKSNIDNFKYIEKVLYSKKKKTIPVWFNKNIETEELKQDKNFKKFIEDFRK